MKGSIATLDSTVNKSQQPQAGAVKFEGEAEFSFKDYRVS
jgi:hypothetical protein